MPTASPTRRLDQQQAARGRQMRGQAAKVVDGALGDHKPHPYTIGGGMAGKLG